MNEEINEEQVESEQNQQTEEEILSYWTLERQKEVKPIPLPTINPEDVKKSETDQPTNGEEIVVDPIGPDV